MIRAALFDIDGTLADNSHRQSHLEAMPKDWDAFHAKMLRDTPRENVVELARHLAEGQCMIVCLTGRPERYRKETAQWLSLHDVPHVALYMRPDGDHRPAEEFKAAIYEEKIRHAFDVRLVLEDDDQVVDMWRELGIECWQVNAKGGA